QRDVALLITVVKNTGRAAPPVEAVQPVSTRVNTYRHVSPRPPVPVPRSRTSDIVETVAGDGVLSGKQMAMLAALRVFTEDFGVPTLTRPTLAALSSQSPRSSAYEKH